MVQQFSESVSLEAPSSEECLHHWIIEAPTGPVSIGVCQRCEEVREFKNYIDATGWAEDTSVSQSPESLPVAESLEDVEFAEEL